MRPPDWRPYSFATNVSFTFSLRSPFRLCREIRRNVIRQAEFNDKPAGMFTTRISIVLVTVAIDLAAAQKLVEILQRRLLVWAYESARKSSLCPSLR
jgi:hypothetical protein